MMETIPPWMSFFIFNIASLVIFLYRVYELRGEHATAPPWAFLFASHIFLMIGFWGFSVPDAPYWLRIANTICFHYATLTTYIHQNWVVNGEMIPFFKSKLVRWVTFLSLLTTLLNILRMDDSSFFISRQPYNPSFFYYAAHLLGFSVSLFLCLLVGQMFYIGLFNQLKAYRRGVTRSVSRIVRRGLGVVSYALAIACVVILIINLSLSIFIGDTYRHAYNQAYFILMPLHSLLLLLGVFPQLIIDIIRWPFIRLFSSKENADHYIGELHSRIKQVTLNIYAVEGQYLDNDRKLYEIGLMRDLLWSHIPSRPVLPADEARFINELLREQRRLTERGPYPGPDQKAYQRQYTVAVARQLLEGAAS
jgi:hypothetical protein